MKNKNIYQSLHNYSQLIGKVIIANINGESVPVSEFKKYVKQINKVPFIIEVESCYCDSCGEYNEDQKLTICHSCNNKLKQRKIKKCRINIYPQLNKFIEEYNKKKFIFSFDDCSIEDIKNRKLEDQNSKIIIHISPYFNFQEKFILHRYNLNHVFLNWENLYEIFESNKLRKLLKQIEDYIFEEKNNIII